MNNEQVVIDKLWNIYNSQGYITEDEFFNLSDEYDLPFYVCDRVIKFFLIRGIAFSNDVNYVLNHEEQNVVCDYAQTDYNTLYQKCKELCPEMSQIIDTISEITPPQHREASNLLKRYQNGDSIAFERLLFMNLRVALRMAYNYQEKTQVTFNDLFQEAVVACINAINSYKFEGSFQGYLSFVILHSLDRYLIDKTSVVDIPVYFYETMEQVKKVDEELNGSESYDYRVNYISEKTKQTKENVRLALRCFMEPFSYEELVDEDDGITVYDDSFEVFQENLNYKLIICDEMWNRLSVKEKQVIRYRYGFGCSPKTLEQVSYYVKSENGGKLTRERIRQIETKAINKIRHYFANKHIGNPFKEN